MNKKFLVLLAVVIASVFSVAVSAKPTVVTTEVKKSEKVVQLERCFAGMIVEQVLNGNLVATTSLSLIINPFTDKTEVCPEDIDISPKGRAFLDSKIAK